MNGSPSLLLCFPHPWRPSFQPASLPCRLCLLLIFPPSYAFFPQLVVFSLLYGLSAPHFDLSSPSTGSNPTSILASRISFFSICLSAAITYSPIAADYFVYYPPSTPPLTLFLLSLAGLTSSFSFCLILGIGLASAIPSTPAYAAASETSLGALIVSAYDPAGGFGRFCGVVVALGTIANLIPPTYSSGVDFQLLSRHATRVPRIVWNTIGVVIYTVCALAGRDHLSEVFTNFLSLVGYFVSIWLAVVLEEHLLFRWSNGKGWKWEDWNEKANLPVGWAALGAFLVGWAGAVVSMDQVWFKSPIAGLVGEDGADVSRFAFPCSRLMVSADFGLLAWKLCGLCLGGLGLSTDEMVGVEEVGEIDSDLETGPSARSWGKRVVKVVA